MALENRLSNNYDPSQGFAGGIRNLGYILAQEPMMRARGQMMQAQRGLYGARSDQAESVAGLNQAKTADLLRKGSLVDTLQKIYPSAEAAMAQGNFDAPEVKTYLGSAAGLLGTDPKVLESGIKQSLGTRLAMTGQPDLAGDVQNPVSTANNRRTVAGSEANALVNANERANRPFEVGQGGTAITPTGTILAQGAANVPAGAVRTGAVGGTAVTPVIESNPKTGSSAVDTAKAQFAKDYLLRQKAPNENETAPTNSLADVMSQLTQSLEPQATSAPGQGAPQGIRVRNKKTGQMGTQLPDGSVIPDQAQ